MTGLLIVPALLLGGGLVAWLDGLQVAREPGSAAFPERWWGYRLRIVALSGFLAAAMICVVSLHMWSVGLALTVAVLLVAQYPVCCAAYGESPGPVRYITTAASRAAASLGFWMLLAVTPQLILALPDHCWLVASSLAVVLLSALHYRRELTLFLLRATPLMEAPAGFERVLAQASLSMPITVYRGGLEGGSSVSSFALPSFRGHVVVMGDSLLHRLDSDGLAAMFAHEVAHLEPWSQRRVTDVTALTAGLVVAAVGGGLALLQMPAERAAVGAALWGATVLLALAIWAIARRGDERVQDLRAMALCGDAAAVIRGLSVVHALRRRPRRLSMLMEEISPYPNLARRLKWIREAAGIAPATLATPVVLSAPGLDRVVILDAERAQWLERVSPEASREPEAVCLSADSIRSLPYRQLTNLRLVIGMRGDTWLEATHRSGRSWRTPIRVQDVAHAQAALDIVDERLAAEPTVTRRRAAVLVILAAAATASTWAHVELSPVFIVAALVIARPRQSPTWLVALLISLWALQGRTAPPAAAASVERILTAIIMVAGVVVFVVGPAARRRATFRPTAREAALVAGALGAFALLLGLDVLWIARSAAASIPSWRIDAIGLSLLAAAAVVALARWRHRWLVAAGGGVLGIAILRWAPTAIAAWAPLASGTPLAVHEARAVTNAVVVLDPSARRLSLSPDASEFSVRVGRSRGNMPYRVVLGGFKGEQQQLSAYDVSFLDGSTALVVGRPGSLLELRALPLPLSEVPDLRGWSIALPPLSEPRLSTDASSRTWTIVGWHPEDADAISIAGGVGDDAPEVKRWIIPGVDASASFLYLPATKTAFSITRTSIRRGAALLSRLAGVPERRWALWKLDGKGGVALAATAADLVCLDPLPTDQVVFCLARHAAYTVIWSVDGRSGTITPIGSVPPVRQARLTSADMRFVMPDGSVLQVPRGGGQAKRLAVAPQPGDIAEMDSTENHVAILVRSRTDARLSLYEIR